MKKVPLTYIIGAIAATFILHRIFSRKQGKSTTATKNTAISNGSVANVTNPTTPVSGTSQTILDGFNENDAEKLKKELTK